MTSGEAGSGAVSWTDRLSLEARALRRAAALIRQAGELAVDTPGTPLGFVDGVLATAVLVESFAVHAEDARASTMPPGALWVRTTTPSIGERRAG